MTHLPKQNWRPSASIETLKQRANIIQKIRQFFALKNVMEVDTPALSQATITDLHLYTFVTTFNNPSSPAAKTMYLQTSPEFAMKRLLCAGSGAIFQLSKAFRNEEAGRFHNPEFTMLEWYQPAYDHFQLMAEMDELLSSILGWETADKISYQNAFKQHLACDPLSASLEELKEVASQYGYADIAAKEQDPDTLLNLLFSQQIEPKIAQNRPCFVYDFPASQAALARISPTDSRVAERFELYFMGIELANGFHELSDPVEQRQRFENDNAKRRAAGLPAMPIDENLLEALSSGLPDCSGVAMGIDRLLMLALNKNSIQDVLAFPHDKA
jgi:lysyl-tRNA synthetase class 2